MKSRSLALAVTIMMVPGSAMADRLQCNMNPGTAKYYIATVLNIEINDFGRARVNDAIIESTDADFVFGEVATDTAQRLSVRWDVKRVKPDPKEYRFRDADLVVRLTIQKGSGAAVMTVLDSQRLGAQYRAEGRCKQVD